MIPNNPSDTTIRRYVANVRRTFDDATCSQWERGMHWYETAHDLAVLLGDGNVITGAGILAALSANKSWRENVRLATDAVSGNVHGHVGDALAKVRRIMAGEMPVDILPMQLKTGNFYRCILDPGDDHAVVVDRHANDIAFGKPLGDVNRGLSSFGRYESLAEVYRRAAWSLNVLPMQVQAVTWVAWTESLAGTSTRGSMYAR